MKTNNILCITEWQRFGVDEIEQVCKKKAQQVFNELVEFAHQETNHCFLKFKNSKTLVAQNYVGLIQTKSGFCVEILPKTFQATKDSEGFKLQNCMCKKSENCEICKAKNILLKMLQSLKDSPFQESHFSNLKAQKLPLLEIFILMFLGEIENLIKKGIKSNYIVQEENRNFLKGKLLFNQNLKINFAHQERFFTSSDEFSQNIAPNRIIKSTLEVLSKQNLSIEVSSKLTQMRFIFAEIPSSQNIDKDLSRCQNTRNFKHYYVLLQWCEIFLKCKAFSVYSGDSKALALLFDMNNLFESFVASEMKKWCNDENFRAKNSQYKEFMEDIFGKSQNISIKTQEKSKFLAENKENNCNIFQLKPDIVGYRKDSEKDSKEVLFIADTKWKIVSNEKDISQADAYQMWAYLSKYKCTKGFLIYPKINNLEQNTEIFEFKPRAYSETNLKICFFSII